MANRESLTCSLTMSTGERRLVKHGYEPGTLALTLHERYLRENEDGIAQYMATYRHDNGRLAW
jgi:hypothetical protein